MNQLHESYNSKPYKWKWDTANVPPNTRRASFRTKFQKWILTYWVIFERTTIGKMPNETNWTVSFRPSKNGMSTLFTASHDPKNPYTMPVVAQGNPYSILKTGQPHRKLVTVVDIIKGFLQDYTPRAIGFSGTEEEPSRNKHYARIIKMVKDRIPGWVGEQSPAPFHEHFYIYPVGREPETLKKRKLEVGHGTS